MRPIGILDSGIGGMAVVPFLKALLPHELICYVGDTAHLPYGEKSTQQIQAYVERIGHFFLTQNCKAVIIACATATAAAAETLQQQMGATIPVVNVIDPLIAHWPPQYEQPWGLIATRYTIATKVYEKKLQAAGVPLVLRSLATPLLADAIEANRGIEALLAQYLGDQALAGIQGLILGCTHYWLIQAQVAAYYGPTFPVIHGAAWVAQRMKQVLEENNALQQVPTAPPPWHDMFYVTEASTAANLAAVAQRILPGWDPSVGRVKYVAL
jgi:glutamate racemase